MKALPLPAIEEQHPFNQPVKFEFVRSPAPWEIKSLQKASIAKTLSTLTVHNQAQNLDPAKTIDCPFSHNQLSCMHYKYNCIPASISFKRKRIFNQPLKILFHSKLSWQEKPMSWESGDWALKPDNAEG